MFFYLSAVNKITQKISKTLPEQKIRLRNKERKRKIESKEVDENEIGKYAKFI